jgi:hypothetical protein
MRCSGLQRFKPDSNPSRLLLSAGSQVLVLPTPSGRCLPAVPALARATALAWGLRLLRPVACPAALPESIEDNGSYYAQGCFD